MKRIVENISLAKSILLKSGITTESPEYSDYLKIKDICGRNVGYIGLLTKFRFVDGITDMDEIESVYNSLRETRIDVSKLFKQPYEELLSQFYDKFATKSNDKKDYELVLKDSEYSYYLVHTYEGILKLGSPAWCLKTKSRWEQYKEKYTHQYVAINNKYLNRLITPESDYLNIEKYISKYSWVRYGISARTDGDIINTIMFDDNNNSIKPILESYTSHGVYITICNIQSEIKKSYNQHLPGCKLIREGSFEVKDVGKISRYLGIEKDLEVFKDFNLKDSSKYYLLTNNQYAYPIRLLNLNNIFPNSIFPCSFIEKHKNKPMVISNEFGMNMLREFVSNNKSTLPDHQYE